MDEARKVCPLLTIAGASDYRDSRACIGSECAWWDGRSYYEPGAGHAEGRCVLVTIARVTGISAQE